MFGPINRRSTTFPSRKERILTPRLSSQMSVQSGWIVAKTIRCSRFIQTDWAEITLWPNLCYEFPLWLICQRQIQPLGFRGWHHPGSFHPRGEGDASCEQLIIHKKGFERNANSMHLACVQMSPIDYWQMQSSLTLFFWKQHWLQLCAKFAVKLFFFFQQSRRSAITNQ